MIEWGTVAQAAGVALSLAALVIAWINRRTDKIAAIERDQDALKARVLEVEAQLEHLPGKDLVHGLQISMVKLEGQMAVIIERVGPIKAIAERLQDVMLEGGHK